MANEKSYKKGDIVVLNSGGPEMEIVEVENEGLVCVCRWDISEGAYREDRFSTAMLSKVNV